MSGPSETIARDAQLLLDAHHTETPLLLINAWDVPSARAVVTAGFPIVATSSRAIAEVLGEPDNDTSDPDLVFSYLSRITHAVAAPVTADLEAGFQLRPGELVDRLLEAGAVGCNLEDTDHHGARSLVDVGRQAEYLAEVRAAGERQGVHVVINARVDTFIRRVGDEQAQLDEAIRRGQRYFEAGADCVYPMAVARREDVEALVAALPGPLNFLTRRGGLSIAELGALGARRVSVASGVFHLLTEQLESMVNALRSGADLDEL